MALVDQELEEVCVEADSVLHHVLVLLDLLAFLEEDGEPGEPVESLGAEVRHLGTDDP